MPQSPRLTPELLQHLPGEAFRFRVRGQCMHPLIKDGQQVGVNKARFYLPGDVLVFVSRQGQCLAHRLIGYYWKQGKIHYLTQADNAKQPDQSVLAGNIIGKLAMPTPINLRFSSLARFARFIRQYVVR